MKKIISTEEAPAAIGPYNQAIVHGNIAYLSGQIALDPNTGELNNETIEEETRQVLENIKAVLKAANSSLGQVLMCQIFVKSMEDYEKINEVYASYFPAHVAPARALVEVSNLPKYVNIEISVTAAIN